MWLLYLPLKKGNSIVSGNSLPLAWKLKLHSRQLLSLMYTASSISVFVPLPGIDVGGNRAHLSPEILNTRPGPRKTINYAKQPVWAAGVLGYEFAGHKSPFESGVTTFDQRGYSVDELPPLRYTNCRNSIHCQSLPRDFTSLVRSMLQMAPSDRPSLQSCLKAVSRLVQNV